MGRAGAARTGLAAALVLAALGSPGCRKTGDAVLVVTVELRAPDNLGAVKLRVTVEDARHQRDGHDFSPKDGAPLSFPTDFTLQLGGAVSSPLRLDVSALDARAVTVAHGTLDEVIIEAGERRDARMVLHCLVDCPAAGVADAAAADGGGDGPAGPDTGPPPACGDGDIDPGELCDPGITGGRPGGCPPRSCDDGVACTADRLVMGGDCLVICEHTAIDTRRSGDGCCPAGGTVATDGDCSATCGNGKVDGDERCDTALPAGVSGACPTSCRDEDPCTADLLVSAGTCAATCLHQPILSPTPGDGCCAPGGGSDDTDCPAVCGNRYRDPRETCDVGAPAGTPDACPTPASCDDGDPCTTDLVMGWGCLGACAHVPVTQAISGDKCCLPGSNRNVDADCAPSCGNGEIEPGEACDRALPSGQFGACSCAASNRACVVRKSDGRPEECLTRCTDEILKCSATPDGCCPGPCPDPSIKDPDCSTGCGNGAVDSGETCDTAIAPGLAGACPTRCQDGDACTSDQLISAGTCHARCDHARITDPTWGDGCCPPGANAALDRDCGPSCGNRVVEGSGGERCDKGIAAGAPGACPTSCPELPPGCARASLTGDAEACTARCSVETVTACVDGDGCCPPGCDAAGDDDCRPVCGDGRVEAPETCDRGITAGNRGWCRAECDDGNACTVDVVLGRSLDCTRTCKNVPIDGCRSGDGCCPAGCTAAQDQECGPPVCNDKYIQRGETCDPVTTCPRSCPEDGDPCTSPRLRGDPTSCTSACLQVPITACSAAVADGCCPTGCSLATDSDCPAPPGKATP
jgi:hypothetical protein